MGEGGEKGYFVFCGRVTAGLFVFVDKCWRVVSLAYWAVGR